MSGGIPTPVPVVNPAGTPAPTPVVNQAPVVVPPTPTMGSLVGTLSR